MTPRASQASAAPPLSQNPWRGRVGIDMDPHVKAWRKKLRPLEAADVPWPASLRMRATALPFTTAYCGLLRLLRLGLQLELALIADRRTQ